MASFSWTELTKYLPLVTINIFSVSHKKEFVSNLFPSFLSSMRKTTIQNCPARSKPIPVLLITALNTCFVIDKQIHYKT